MSEKDFVSYIGPLASEDMKKTGILASVTAAQAILESGYGQSELAVNAHNLFGMKASLSGNTWESEWDGQTYTKKTNEQKTDGTVYEITADFRKYVSDAASIRDHSDYLRGAMNGTRSRYDGIIGEKDPRTAAQIIKNGGYATSLTYVDKLMNVIEKWGLTAYDVQEETKEETMSINIISKTSTANTSVYGSRPIKYIVEHYTAGVTSKKGSARNTASWFAQEKAQASADFIVDDEEIVQYNPDPANRYCWAVGGGKYNNKGGRLYGTATNKNTISIEICSTNDTGKVTSANDSHFSFTSAVLDRAVELTKYLMEKYGIDADHVIRHYDVNGKPCPGIVGWNEDSGSVAKWEAFKARLSGAEASVTPSASSTDKTTTGTTLYRVRKSWADSKSQLGAYKILDNAKKTADVNAGYKVFDASGNCVYDPDAGTDAFSWHVKISNLRIRKGPGVNYEAVGYTGVGTFTIVETSGAWGRLKSGAGWISLSEAYGYRV